MTIYPDLTSRCQEISQNHHNLPFSWLYILFTIFLKKERDKFPLDALHEQFATKELFFLFNSHYRRKWEKPLMLQPLLFHPSLLEIIECCNSFQTSPTKLTNENGYCGEICFKWQWVN